jgi:GT2 family glycosyltransferase
MNKVYAVLPVFNRLAYTKKCLASFAKQKYKNFEVIIIDDGSTDGTNKFISKKYPLRKIIRGNGNWWWTKSIYEGVKKARKTAKLNDYILLMNNDCFFGPNYISQLVRTAKRFPNSIIGSLAVRVEKPSEVVEAGVRIDWPTGLVYGVAQTVSKKLSYYKNIRVVENLDALPGKGTLIPLKVFKKIRNFDYKRFPHYIADYEFTNRAKRAGFILIVDTKSIVQHLWDATGDKFDQNQPIGLSRAYNLLFGKKSMSNIIDWIRFIKSVCPEEYKNRNYYFSLLKLLKALFSIPPFYQTKPIFRYVYFNSLQIYHYIRLFQYRYTLKIIQLPQNPKLVKIKKYLLK